MKEAKVWTFSHGPFVLRQFLQAYPWTAQASRVCEDPASRLGAVPESVSAGALSARQLPDFSSSALPGPAVLRYQHAGSDAQWHQRGLLRALSQQSGGRAGGGIHGPAEKKCQLWDSECRPHHLCRDWGDVAILHRGFPRAQSWPCSSVGDESSVHRFCIYVAHLGQVHALIDLPTSICHLKKKEKNQRILDQKCSDFLFTCIILQRT